MRISEPLGTVRLYLRLNPNAADSQALRKVLVAIADVENAEPMRDAMLFQGELGELTAALLDARMAGQYSIEQWKEAATY